MLMCSVEHYCKWYTVVIVFLICNCSGNLVVVMVLSCLITMDTVNIGSIHGRHVVGFWLQEIG